MILSSLIRTFLTGLTIALIFTGVSSTTRRADYDACVRKSFSAYFTRDSSSTQTTVDGCLDFCTENVHVATIRQTNCTCLDRNVYNIYQRALILRLNDCDIPCAGNEEESCGGSGALSVYTLQNRTCRDPGIPTDGNRNGNDFSIGSIITFYCNAGYVLVGPTSIQCTWINSNALDINWTATMPTCKESTETTTFPHSTEPLPTTDVRRETTTVDISPTQHITLSVAVIGLGTVFFAFIVLAVAVITTMYVKLRNLKRSRNESHCENPYQELNLHALDFRASVNIASDKVESEPTPAIPSKREQTYENQNVIDQQGRQSGRVESPNTNDSDYEAPF